ncbi:hypothetical protein DER44DRAFT_858869 [Fusarium oxysporum]|nr:hypothetical protein DER44DRAFT_858869 [Fusarium oxysporum]
MSRAVPITIARTLTRDQALEPALEFAHRHGLSALLRLFQVLTQWTQRRASRQQEQTYQEIPDALPQSLNCIQAREIRAIANAFNSTPAFLAYFQAAALGSIPLIANVARVQGWGHGGFGTYVHGFVQNEMAAVDGAQDGQHHLFYVWHPDSDWHPAFEGRQTQDPLGPAFGGYHHDLATICLRMRADREALIATTDYRRTAVFHLVIPAYYPLVMDHPIAFAYELLPLVVTGGRHRGTDLVWFAIRPYRGDERLHLNFIGRLNPDRSNLAIRGGMVGMQPSVIGTFGCALAAVAFPPCAPVAAIMVPSGLASAFTCCMAVASGIVYDSYTHEPTQVLGNPIFLE